ncbi:uncharacterized protein LOC119912920, partial [Scomber scombrus]
VKEHKNSRTLGQACVNLDDVEYGWLARLANGVCCRNAFKTQYVFHTVVGEQIGKPCAFLKDAWRDAGLKG